MKIGVMSDTHNHVENTRQAVRVFRGRGVERVIHCGDITTPIIVNVLDGLTMTFVFGNMDHSHADLMVTAKDLFGIGSMGYHYTAAIEGKKMAVCHGDDEDMLRGFIEQGDFDYVFHGHTHQRRDELIGRTRVINPGALGGRESESRSVCVLDLETGVAEFVMIGDEG